MDLYDSQITDNFATYLMINIYDMGAVLLIILIGILLFVVLGLLGWGIQALGFIGSFLGEGITGCFGCFGRFIWFIIAAIIIFILVGSVL